MPVIQTSHESKCFNAKLIDSSILFSNAKSSSKTKIGILSDTDFFQTQGEKILLLFRS